VRTQLGRVDRACRSDADLRAFDPPGRPLILIVAGVSKAIFIVLVLSQGGRYLGHQAGLAVAIDSVMIALFAWYLLAARAA